MSTSSLDHTIFRKNAIDNLNSVETIHSLLKIIHPYEWLWIVFAILIMSSVLIWGFLGTITLSIEAQGILFPEKKLIEIENHINQTIKERNDKVLLLEDLYNKKKSMYIKHYLTIDSLLKAKDEYIAAKEDLSDPNKNLSLPLKVDYSNSLINSANTALEALVFVDRLQGKKITAGMDVYILPNALSQYDSGYILGTVVSISEYPISKQLAYSYISNINLVDDFFVNGAPFVVKIQLKKNPLTSSGLAWTTKQGSNFSIQPGSMVNVKILYKKCSPFNLIKKKL